MARTFYRMVKADPPTLTDFMSHQALGKVPRRPTPELMEMWRGVSTYDDIEVARRLATRGPDLGGSIAILIIEVGLPSWRHDPDSSAANHALFGEPAELLQRVTRVEPV